MRTCRTCKTEKPLTEYYMANKGTTYFKDCKPCDRKRARESMERLRRLDPHYVRRGRLQRRYGITPEQYDDMLAAQGGVCAICKDPGQSHGTHDPRTGKLRRMPVDHDHVSGKVRGLLCSDCNRAIGLLRDDPERFERAALYILAGRNVLEGVVF